MNKVKLLLDDLQVESFEVDAGSRGIGTVRGLEAEGSGVHSQCYTHCAGGNCEPVESVMQTHCDAECPSWDGACQTNGEYTCNAEYTCNWFLECGGGTLPA